MSKVHLRDIFWIVGGCRIKEGFAAMLGLNVLNAFNLGYSYDVSTTRLNTVSRGTHEMIVGFLMGNRYKDTCQEISGNAFFKFLKKNRRHHWSY